MRIKGHEITINGNGDAGNVSKHSHKDDIWNDIARKLVENIEYLKGRNKIVARSQILFL